jgi:hypothetical protein
MNNIVFVADYYSDKVIGGAEKYNDVLISHLEKLGSPQIKKIKSVNLTLEITQKNADSFFVVANFMQLSEQVKEYISTHIQYIIIEHDHKYLTNNNPVRFKDYLANEESIQNLNFYRCAKAVFCQSTLHAEIIYKNTLLQNLVNLEGNIWSEDDANILEEYLDPEKKIKYGIFGTQNSNKGMTDAIDYCNANSLKYTVIPSCPYPEFVERLSLIETLVFFPTWIESFSRVAVEARILGCKIITNDRLGCASDGFLNMKGTELLDRIKRQTLFITKKFTDIISGKKLKFYERKLPRVSIITTFVDGEEYLKGWLDSCVNQTIFDEIDLYIYDAASDGNEQKIVQEYTTKYNNIHYHRADTKIGSSEAFNKLMESSPNEFISMVCLDDRPAANYAEVLRKYLCFADVDLVYADCYQTHHPNETFAKNSSNGIHYIHSINDFSPYNMIKSLPGPMPLFKKKIILKNGGFNVKYKHANDWELWLRCVRANAVFLKAHTTLGLYYYNPSGVTTSKQHQTVQRAEEKEIFYEYIDVLGQENFETYKPYFDQF